MTRQQAHPLRCLHADVCYRVDTGNHCINDKDGCPDYLDPRGCASHSAGKGELEYGTVSRDGVDWRLRRFDAGMGETEYRIFRNETFFAKFDNRDNADDVMEFVTGVHDATHSAAADTPASKQTRATKLNWDGKRCVCNEFYNCHDCRDFLAFNKEHDAAIRKAECERLLKKFDTLAETKWFAVDVGDPDGNVCVVSTDDIENLIKSLREGVP